MAKWNIADSKAAARQGWNLFSVEMFPSGIILCIQRLDDPQASGVNQSRARFPSDEAASGYVLGRAEMGDKLAKKALKLIGKQPLTIGSLRDFNIAVA